MKMDPNHYFLLYQFVNPTSKGAGKKSLMDLDHIERCASPSGSCENDRSLLKLHLHREYEPCSHVSKSSLNSSISPRSARYKVVFIKKITFFLKWDRFVFKNSNFYCYFFVKPKDTSFEKRCKLLGCVIQSPLELSETYFVQNFPYFQNLASNLTSEVAHQSTSSVFLEVF